MQNNLGKNKKTDSKLIIPKKNNTEKKIDDSLSGNKKIVSSTEKENLAFIKENPNKETEKKKLVDILPEEERELDLAKKYTNDNFKNKLSEYQLLNEIELYRSAFQQVKDKKYNDSIDTFNAFLYLFPQSNYASNAQYWLSESIYALGDFSNAMINFAKVVEKYPNSSKIADAKLKIGYCYYSIKKWKEARFIFSDIIKKYPNTSLSQLADKKIKSMDVEGR